MLPLIRLYRPTILAAASALLLSLSPLPSLAEGASITVQVDQPGIPMAPTMHGLFFEDINYAADGGLYAELVQNRSFEHREATYSWSETLRGEARGKIAIERDAPLNASNPQFLRLQVSSSGTGSVGAENPGFDGIALRSGENYRFSIYSRRHSGAQAALKIQLEDPKGRVLACEDISNIGSSWEKHEFQLKSASDEQQAKLVVLATEVGAVDVDMVSLFPEKTFMGRRNGLRADLAQALADVKPGFLRFPGGCVVEGQNVANMYRWKDTIGDVSQRKQNWNLWQNSSSPQYSQTYGLGFFEFFQFCEDIGTEPLPVLNCGMVCQARSDGHAPIDQLDPYVQDALDLIEFANGPSTSEWGAKRAAMGHPHPFNLKYLGVGNEQWNQEYFDRYAVFYKALKDKHPEIVLITTAGPQANDSLWRFAWNKFNSGTPAEIVDEHYYRPPHWFLEHNNRYDSYDRKGPKIFVGEYAAHDIRLQNNLRSAIAEAAFGTGLWRNAEVVAMSAYAPMLANRNHAQWRPDLIWFDNTQVVLTPNYHVQALLSQNHPDVVLPSKIEAAVVSAPVYTGRIGVGTSQSQAEFRDIAVIRDGQTLFMSDFSKGTSGWDPQNGYWTADKGVLQQSSLNGDCSIYVGDPTWNNYTLSLKARKKAGVDGFLVSFATQDRGALIWRVGTNGNAQHRLEIPGATDPYIPGHIENDRWYDLRVELKGPTVKCFLDGVLIQEAVCEPTRSLYAASGHSQKSGEIIIAVANPTDSAQNVRINLAGLTAIKSSARAIVLSSASPDDINSFENPGKVRPAVKAMQLSGPKFEYEFPACSFTILRIAP